MGFSSSVALRADARVGLLAFFGQGSAGLAHPSGGRGHVSAM
jgi:hypothetical protein